MHSEFYQLSEEAATTLRSVKEMVVASLLSELLLSAPWRLLVPSLMGKSKQILAGPTSLSNLGMSGKVVDAFSTNFHLPKSTLVMLVSAFAGRELVLDAYHHAIQEHYRFFSFGDAMFIY